MIKIFILIERILDVFFLPIISPPGDKPPPPPPPPDYRPTQKPLQNCISPGLITGILRYSYYSISLYTGCFEGKEASHLDGCNCQCHLWNLLGNRLSDACHRRLYFLQAQFVCNSHCSHDDHVQFRCQSVCICSDKPTFQEKDERNVVL